MKVDMHIVNPDLPAQRRRVASDEPGADQTARTLTRNLNQGAAA